MTHTELQWLQRALIAHTTMLVRDDAGRIVGIAVAPPRPRPEGPWDQNTFRVPVASDKR